MTNLTMKNSFVSLSLSAAVAAILLPISIGFSASVIAVAGVLALALRDYSREIKPLSLSSLPAGAARRTNLRLAA